MKINKFIQRTILLVLSFVMIMQVTPLFAQKSDDENIAYVIFGKALKTHNIKSLTVGSPNMATPSVAGESVEVWEIKGSGVTYPYMYIDLDNSLGNSLCDGSEYEIEIEYFDKGTGYIIVWYDAIEYGAQIGYEIYGTDTQEWKTARFVLNDAKFCNGVREKADIVLSLKEFGSKLTVTPFPMLLKSIKITRIPNKNPILAEAFSDAPGNTYPFYEKEKIIKNKFTNTTNESANITVTYRMVNIETKDVEFKKEERFTVGGGKTVASDVNIVSENCGIYKWYIDIKSDDSSINSTFEEDELCIVKADPNGIRSEFGWINCHLERYNNKEMADLVQLLNMANMAGIRHCVDWSKIERKKDYFSTHNVISWDALQMIRDGGLKTIMRLHGNNSAYNKSKNNGYMPTTQEEFDGWRNYCRYVIEQTKDFCEIYEIWNEPNITSFNPNGGKPEHLTEMTRIAREELNKLHPTALLAGMSITELNRDDARYWRDKTLECGIVDGDNGMNAMALHSYHRTTTPEYAKMYDLAVEYQEKVEKYGIKDIPVLITEYGFTTADDNTGEYNQGNWNVRGAILHKAYGVGDYMCIYNMEQKGVINTDREDNFGIIGPSSHKYNVEGKTSVPTTSYLAYAGMNYVLGGHIAVDEIIELDNDVYITSFDSDKFGKKVASMWSASESQVITVKLGVDRVEYYDRYGNCTVVNGEEGVFTFVLDGRPSYIMGDFDKIEIINDFAIAEYNKINIACAEGDTYVVEVQSAKDRKYNVKVVSHGSKAAENVKTLVDRKAEFYIDTDGKLGESNYVDVYMYNGDKTVHYAQLPVSFYEKIGTELKFELVSTDNFDNWLTTAKITNYLSGSSLDGYIKFAEPAEFASLGEIKIDKIAPGETSEIKFNIPNLIEKGFKNLKYSVVTNNGNSVLEYEEKYDFNIAPKTKKNIVIDGVMAESEWPDNIAMSAKAPGNFSALEGFECVDEKDKSANVSVMWDDERLYLFSEVEDDIYFQEETAQYSWRGDSIQFGLLVDVGEQESVAIGQSNTNFHEFAISVDPANGSVNTYRHKTQDNRTAVGLCESAISASKRLGTKMYYEWSMPWEDIVGIKDWKPQVNQELGFSILWNDNDGNGRKGWIEYASGIGGTKDSRLFTYLKMIG